MTEMLPKVCERCGTHMIIKVRASPNRAILEWYYYCDFCSIREIFLEEPMEDE